MSYLVVLTLQDGVTLVQESAARGFTCSDGFPLESHFESKSSRAALSRRFIDSRGSANKMKTVPPRKAANFFSDTGLRKTAAVTSHLLPTYARVDLAFERGEGPW